VIQDVGGWLTIHDVAKANGWELSNRQAWQAGDLLRRAWRTAVGTDPVKDLRTKKIGIGSHCFALYPPQWRERIERAIRSVRPDEAAQASLPLESVAT